MYVSCFTGMFAGCFRQGSQLALVPWTRKSVRYEQTVMRPGRGTMNKGNTTGKQSQGACYGLKFVGWGHREARGVHRCTQTRRPCRVANVAEAKLGNVVGGAIAAVVVGACHTDVPRHVIGAAYWD